MNYKYIKKDNFLSQKDLMNTDYHCDYLIEGLLRDKCVSILSAAAKTGKTSFAIDLANAVAQGTKFLGIETKQTNVLYLCLDDNESVISERCKFMGLPTSNNVIYSFYRDFDIFDMNKVVEEYLSTGINFGLIIIDMLSDIRVVDSTSEYSNADMKRDIKLLRSMSDQYEISILALHHNKKKVEKNFIQSLMGPTGLTGTLNGSIMGLSRVSPLSSEGILEVTGRNVPSNSYNLHFDKDKIRYSIVETAIDPISMDLVKIINYITSKKLYEGTVQQLCAKLNIITNPRIIGKDIKNNIRELESNGIVYKGYKSNGNRIIRLELADDFNYKGHQGVVRHIILAIFFQIKLAKIDVLFI